jgi:tetratricopeptide (TPR) repeat protein
MTDQLSIFSSAGPHLNNAYLAIERLDFDLANDHLNQAKKIDPWITNLESTQKIVQFYKDIYQQKNNIPDFITETWLKIPEAVNENRLLISEAHFADLNLSKIADKHLNSDNSFIDRKEILHKACLLILGKNKIAAQKKLLDSLTTTHCYRADLWGYYGDVCMILNRFQEAHTSYVRALILDPQDIDLFRLKSKDLNHIYFQLIQEFPERDARELLLFYGWYEDLLKIPKFNKDQPDLIQNLKNSLIKGIPKDNTKRLYNFSICFYLDQSLSGEKTNYEYRERMMKLDKELFTKYREKLPG